MLIKRTAPVSKTALKAHSDFSVGNQKSFWIADIGDRIEQQFEYSSRCEEEGTCNADWTGNQDIKESNYKLPYNVPNGVWRNDIYRIADNNYGSQPS